ncbi:hypothetical protein EHS25_002404 [Saitozyma podzolica]|uniref:RRM domain-containing protein n=1 Tax=Saitozyma podzolica TaxID=1890683 RepID=A0A427YE10_9TREE|nr:hypothetical protein EHS25_002404 [Saitozyma podzolica]
MSDPNDVWQNSAPKDGYESRSPPPRRDVDMRSPRRDRSRSPARNGAPAGGGGGGDRGRGPEESNQGNNLHISGLARVIDNRMLEDMFSKVGKIDKAEVMFDPHTQESRGFGFVKFFSSDDANAAIEQFNGTNQEGKVMTVAHARRGRARTPTPGRYHGVKVETGPRYGGGGYGGGGYGQDRPYQPRSYDSRYSDRGPPPRGGGYYDDRRYDDRRDDRRYDDRRDYGRDRYDDYRSGPPPMDRGDRGGYDRRDPRDDRPRYDERPRY